MINYITADRIANAIMQDTSFSGYYLIVEGNKDYKLYKKFFSENIRIREAWGCEKLREAMVILEERGFENKIGIIDSDFSRILDIKWDINDLFITDYHDIEVMMIKSNALFTVLNVYCKEEKIHEFCDITMIYNIIVDIGKQIGILKFVNEVYKLGLIFKPKEIEGNQLKYKEFVSEKDLSFLGVEKMIQTVINYSNGKSKNIQNFDTILQRFMELSNKNYDEDQLVNGHDLSHILFILCKKVLKSSNRMLVDFNSIEDSLILSYEAIDFVETKLFENLLKWSIENQVELFKKSVYAVHEGINKESARIAN